MNPNNSDIYLPGTITIPSSLVIIDITNSFPMVVTVIVNNLKQENTYQQGQLVKLNVPITYGMFQADGLIGRIISNIDDLITLDIDSRKFDVFKVPDSSVFTPANLSPFGARNLILDNTTRLVPFQSLNNRGN